MRPVDSTWSHLAALLEKVGLNQCMPLRDSGFSEDGVPRVATLSREGNTNISSLLNSTFENCLGERGICPETIFVCVSMLGNVCKATPLYRLRNWLVRQRGNCNPVSIPQADLPAEGSLSNLLPTHLPLSPVAVVSPEGSHTGSVPDFVRTSAWLVTEWLITLFNYFELGCPKSTTQYADMLGTWCVSEA